MIAQLLSVDAGRGMDGGKERQSERGEKEGYFKVDAESRCT